jgi:hypothetical protein
VNGRKDRIEAHIGFLVLHNNRRWKEMENLHFVRFPRYDTVIQREYNLRMISKFPFRIERSAKFPKLRTNFAESHKFIREIAIGWETHENKYFIIEQFIIFVDVPRLSLRCA